MKMKTPRWWPQLERAALRNASFLQDPLFGGLRTVDDAAIWWRRNHVYRFEGPYSHKIVDVERSLARGFGACGDAVAFVGAFAWLHGSTVNVCVEAHDDVDDYKHVSLLIDGEAVDPVAEHALATTGCIAQHLLLGRR